MSFSIQRLNQKIVFICGAGHSGSTLLGLILGSHSQCFYAGETNKTRFFNTVEQKNIIKDCKLCGPTCQIWNAVDITSSLDLYEQLSKITARKVIIDSTKDLTWLQQQITIMNTIEVKLFLIYLLRDGRAVINSRIRKYPYTSVESHIMDWKKQIELTNEVYNNFTRKRIKVHYEDIATHPSQTIRNICQFVGLNSEPDMVNYFNFEHHPLGGNNGTQFLIVKAQNKAKEDVIKLTHQNREYYSNHPLNIKLDLRWKEELKKENLMLFEQLVGDLNIPFRRDY